MHLGRNVARLRELKGIKQEEFAKLLGITQQAVSKLENKDSIDEKMLEVIAEKFDIPIDVIKKFNPESTIQSLYQQGGNVVQTLNINPIEKIIELYERIIMQQQLEITRLQKQLKEDV